MYQCKNPRSLIYFLFFFFSSQALHHRPQPGGLAHCHDHQPCALYLTGVIGLCHPPSGHLLGPLDFSNKLILVLHSLCYNTPVSLQQSNGGMAGVGAAAISTDVLASVPGTPGHSAAQQSAAECLLQEHRLTQQHQFHFPLRSQSTHEQVPGTHTPGFYHALLVYLGLGVCSRACTYTKCV